MLQFFRTLKLVKSKDLPSAVSCVLKEATGDIYGESRKFNTSKFIFAILTLPDSPYFKNF